MGRHLKTIIFASGNAGKMKEVREILSDTQVNIYSMREAGLEADPEEIGTTFAENALIKARAVAARIPESGLDPEETIVLADDSGLEIDALGGEPGIYSARYMGKDTSYRVKNAELIRRLEGVPKEKRTARFVCEIAAVLPDGTELTERGTIEGKIGYEERGENGFGYDPIFYLPDMSRTTAELPPEKKNAISHRGAALRAIKAELKRRGILS
ncbi:MAG: RdgB/HAM1 family non-canonical purine NTP pyrophosphatase [Bilifractor sp.]|jgi:XTP/dITP diphosphohydrolase